jgi:hypothetical protein
MAETSDKRFVWAVSWLFGAGLVAGAMWLYATEGLSAHSGRGALLLAVALVYNLARGYLWRRAAASLHRGS